MGKKSLTQSTTKKKATLKKSAPKKKQADAAKSKVAAPSLEATSPDAKQSAESQKPSIQSLINKDFGEWSPKASDSVEPGQTDLKNYTAPPIIDETNQAEADRMKTLLTKKFDLPAADEPKPSVATPAEEATPSGETETSDEKITASEKERDSIEAMPDKKQETPQASAADSPVDQSPKKDICSPMPALRVERKKPMEPSDMGRKLMIGCIAVLFAALFIASGINADKYYLKKSDAGIEIWKGKFSPAGKERLTTVPGVEVLAPIKPYYTKEEALKPAFNYYVQKADELFAAKGTLDYEAIKSLLNNALPLAPTRNESNMVLQRLNSIDFTLLLYKANEASRTRSPQNIEKALGFLNQAQTLKIDKSQHELLAKRITELKTLKETLGKPQPTAPKTSPQKTESKKTKKEAPAKGRGKALL